LVAAGEVGDDLLQDSLPPHSLKIFDGQLVGGSSVGSHGRDYSSVAGARREITTTIKANCHLLPHVMNVLLDSCISGTLRAPLEKAGHHVEWIGDWPSDPGDGQIHD
jgi:hypothetical protein